MPLPKVLPQVSKAQQHVPQGPVIRIPSDSAGQAERRTRGKVVANRYGVERKLGSGAFGTAFLVTDLKASNDK